MLKRLDRVIFARWRSDCQCQQTAGKRTILLVCLQFCLQCHLQIRDLQVKKNKVLNA